MLVQVVSAERVEIVSESMEAMDAKKEIQFIGDVNITQLQDWLHGDKVTVYFDENNETRKYKATGAVTFEFKNEKRFYKGSADVVTYYPQKTLYILTGKAIVDDLLNKRHINGDHITLDMTNGNASVIGTKVKPVKFTFDMNSAEKKDR